MANRQVRVFLLEKQADSRALIFDQLSSRGSFVVAGSAADLIEIPALWKLRPDVVVMDEIPLPAPEHPFFGAAKAHDAGLILHCSLPPLIPCDQLQLAGIGQVVLKEIGTLDRLVAAIMSFC